MEKLAIEMVASEVQVTMMDNSWPLCDKYKPQLQKLNESARSAVTALTTVTTGKAGDDEAGQAIIENAKLVLDRLVNLRTRTKRMRDEQLACDDALSPKRVRE